MYLCLLIRALQLTEQVEKRLQIPCVNLRYLYASKLNYKFNLQRRMYFKG